MALHDSGQTITRLAITFTNDETIFVDRSEESFINNSGYMRGPTWRKLRDYGPPDHLLDSYDVLTLLYGWYNMDHVVSICEVEGMWTVKDEDLA